MPVDRRHAMMIIAAAACAPAAAHAQAWLHDPFDATRLNDAEIMALQAALSLTQDYDGMQDGAWGRRSDAALRGWHVRRNGPGPLRWVDLAGLVRGFDDEWRGNGWSAIWLSQFGDISFFVPFGLVRETASGPDHLKWEGMGAALSINAALLARPEMERAHDRIVGEALRNGLRFRLRERDLWVTEATMLDGSRMYARSEPDHTGRSWGHMSLWMDRAHFGRMALIAGSFMQGRPEPGGIPGGGRLEALLRA